MTSSSTVPTTLPGSATSLGSYETIGSTGGLSSRNGTFYEVPVTFTSTETSTKRSGTTSMFLFFQTVA